MSVKINATMREEKLFLSSPIFVSLSSIEISISISTSLKKKEKEKKESIQFFFTFVQEFLSIHVSHLRALVSRSEIDFNISRVEQVYRVIQSQ